MTYNLSTLNGEKITFLPEKGQICLEDARFLLVSADGLGTLTKDLISTLGRDRAKGFLLRYGWTCGYNDARIAQRQNPDHSELSLLYHGAYLHSLEGSTHVNVLKAEINLEEKHCLMESTWSNSHEAEQYCRHFGLSEELVCWTLTGYASGFASAIFGQRVLFREVKCVGMGDQYCQVICKPVEEWGTELEGELDYFTESKISEELEEAHRRIKKQNKFLKQVMGIHEELNRLILEGGHLKDIVEVVGNTLGNPIIAEDRYLETLAAWAEPGKELSSFLLSSIEPASDFIRKQLAIIKREKKTIDIICKDHSLLPRTVTPIIIESNVYGYLSIIHSTKVNIELIHLIAERVAEVIGFILLQERMIFETENRFKGKFIR
ncbi:XylR N-terminal domain-containing protein [Neobacillus vireti]|uniref:XylR N-terminal domain-containing protein n=1 Tax=Neobacillus vireti TaxID=220686 RepID=UPI002FFFD24E